MDLRNADLRDHDSELLKKIKWHFKSEHAEDTLSYLGEYWYNKLDVQRLKGDIVDKVVHRTDHLSGEQGIVYGLFIEKNADRPCLLVWYNVNPAHEKGFSRCAEWCDLKFDSDIDLRNYLLF